MELQKIMIKIAIADREYPLRVNEDEADVVREAGRLLNENISAYKQRFKIQDTQDLLAMVAFDGAIEKMLKERQQTVSENLILNQLAQLDDLVSQTLKA